MNNQLKIFDTLLRDGSQSSDVNFSLRDKLEIVAALDEFGIDYIELGWPGSNPKDMGAFLEAEKLKLKNAKIVAFGSTRRKGIKAEEDPNLNAILESKAKIACIFGKTILDHIKLQLKTTPEENLLAIEESIKFLKSKNLEVFYDLEHFFDGYKDDKEYALNCLATASKAGADVLVLCDTNGGTLPSEFKTITQEVKEYLGKNNIETELGIHTHNDSGTAIANALVAVDLGITHVQGTVNGFGERAGNADLCQLIPNLVIKKNIKLGKVDLKKLSTLSGLVYLLANIKQNNHQPFVGKNAFAHKGGIHVDAIMKGASYEHIDPQLVGNKRDIILSELSGKSNIVEVVKKFGYKLDKNDPKVKDMLNKVEELEKKGYDIGDLKAEKFLLNEQFFGNKNNLVEIESWKVTSEQKNGEFSECSLKGKVDGKNKEIVDSVKGGPVDVIFKALKKMIATSHQPIEEVKLINFKVMMAEDLGAESSVRVYIEFKNGKEEWGTVGVNTNILEASFEAIEKGFRYYLLKNK